MKISLAQIDVIAGQPNKNVAKMLHFIEEAKQQKVDLIVFPEMCVGGYFLSDMWTNETFCERLMNYNKTLQEASEGIGIVYGNVYVAGNGVNKDGRKRKYNAAYFFYNKKCVKRVKSNPLLTDEVQPKTLLPHYRMFDDTRYFSSLNDIAKENNTPIDDLFQPFKVTINGKERKIGIELCEDMWCENYVDCPSNLLTKNGAEFILNLSASPWTLGKNEARHKRVLDQNKEFDISLPRLYVNCIGAQNTGKNIVTFDGGTTIYNKDGVPSHLLITPYKEGILTVNEDQFNTFAENTKITSPIEQKYHAIICGLRHISNMTGVEKPKFVIGLSGGIDSAVVLCLLERAFGATAVTAINMPSQYNSNKTKNAAKQLANNLSVRYLSVPIGEIVKSVETTISGVLGGGEKIKPLNAENIQAKIRGTDILSNVAAILGAFFTNNGNKLEMAQGYATLYGDVNGIMAPIGDLLKTEVYDLAHFLNNSVYKEEKIPSVMLPNEAYQFEEGKIVPSAELKESQKDPFDTLYHSRLLERIMTYNAIGINDVLEWFLQGKIEEELELPKGYLKTIELSDKKYFRENTEWFFQNIYQNTFKRVQSPPIIITSRSAFGYDYRESQLVSPHKI